MKIIVGLHLLLAASAALADEPAWTKARQQAPQRGMIYEYYDVKNKPWVQGEGLDTMHDGAVDFRSRRQVRWGSRSLTT
jgi:hypothetical protein